MSEVFISPPRINSCLAESFTSILVLFLFLSMVPVCEQGIELLVPPIILFNFNELQLAIWTCKHVRAWEEAALQRTQSNAQLIVQSRKFMEDAKILIQKLDSVKHLQVNIQEQNYDKKIFTVEIRNLMQSHDSNRSSSLSHNRTLPKVRR